MRKGRETEGERRGKDERERKGRKVQTPPPSIPAFVPWQPAPTDKQTDRERQTDRQTDRQRQTDRLTDI